MIDLGLVYRETEAEVNPHVPMTWHTHLRVDSVAPNSTELRRALDVESDVGDVERVRLIESGVKFAWSTYFEKLLDPDALLRVGLEPYGPPYGCPVKFRNFAHAKLNFSER